MVAPGGLIAPFLARRAAPLAAPLHAAIAGGGVGGLTAALALARAGLRVTLFERAPAFGEVGAGLQLASNATARLRALGLLEPVLRLGVTPEQLRIRRARDGRDLAKLPLGPIAELRWGAPYIVIHRADLMRALVEACAAEPAITLMTGATVMGFAVANGGVEIGARRGDETLRIEADALIGADGLRSHLRERIGLGLSDQPAWSGRVAWRALVPTADAPAFARKLETGLWLGARAHLVHYPVRQGDLINVVAITEGDWRAAEAPDLWDIAGAGAAMAPSFARWHADARALIASAPDWLRWPLFDRAPARRWTIPRVALLGDAAHPMLPFLAQGAAQAIEDAGALGDAFARHGANVDAALADDQAARVARAAAVVMTSRRQGAIYHMSGPMAVARDLVMGQMSPARMLAKMDWLYAGPVMDERPR